MSDFNKGSRNIPRDQRATDNNECFVRGHNAAEEERKK